MQDHDIASEPIPSSDGFGLEHGETLHSEDCECLQCTMYWSITDAVIDAMLVQVEPPEPLEPCEGDDCQGCPKCPEWAHDPLNSAPFQSPYITLEELQALDPNPQLQDTTPYTGPYLVIPPTSYHSYELAEWLARADEHVTWHIPIIAPAGLITLLSGGPKSGKTQLYWGLLKEAYEHGTVLGDPVNRDLNIEFWTEERPQTLKEKANTVHLTTIPPWTITGVHDMGEHDWLKMVTHAAIDWERHDDAPDVLIVDTIGAWAQNEDWNDYARTIAALTPLNLLSARFPKMAVVIAHHNRKAKGDPVDASSGSNALTGKVDNIVSLDKTDSCDDYTRRLRFMGRVQPQGLDGVDLYVRFDPITGVYTKEGKGQRFEDAVLDVMPDTEETALSPRAIHDAIPADEDGVKPTYGTVRNHLTRLHADGVLVRIGEPRKYRYYQA